MYHPIFLFDAYGTLFDVHSAVRRHAAELGPDAQRLSELWRTKQLEYSWIRSTTGAYKDFWALTKDALDAAFEACGIASTTRAETLDVADFVRLAQELIHDA